MAEGGTSSFDSLSYSRRKQASNPFSGNGNPPALDGSFLLQLLQKKPQATSSPSSTLFPNEDLHPYQDPAVAAIVPGFPFLPHQILSQPPSSFAPEIGNCNYLGRQQFLQMEDRRLGHPPSGVSPLNSNLLNRIPREISSRQHRDGILSTDRARDLGGKKNSAHQGQYYRASTRPPPGFKKSSYNCLAEVNRKMESGVRSKTSSNLHNVFEWKPAYNEEVRSAEAFKASSRVNPQAAKNERSDGKQRVWKILDDDAQHRGLPDKCNADELIHSACSGLPILDRCDSIGENESEDSGKKMVGIQISEEVDHTKFIQHFSGDAVCSEEDLLGEQLAAALSGNPACDNETKNFRSSLGNKKDARMDFYRGHLVSSQRVRIRRRELRSRPDLDSFIPFFLSIFKSLVPSEEEIIKQEQLLLMLMKLVKKEWPDAELHIYGSCANSFGVSNSDIDVCLAINGHEINKVDILLKLADILESNNLQNVQALTRARVPIVKMMDPLTGLSCDICANNLLAVVNTKLLKDYAQIDPRLRQLAFIVKHWAKSRRVNETYHGTLSSYAYVLMCIHFLQMRKPAILPCLQGMKATCQVIVDGIECSYFDKVKNLRNFGARNKESITQLLWAFFHYWAYCHDYINDVISVRTGSIISKQEKDWTRRIGNDRHLICIEDPFEVSHDLGRVVDKFSIKILREEFERAADILQYDQNPNVLLFESYVPGSPPKLEPDELLL